MDDLLHRSHLLDLIEIVHDADSVDDPQVVECLIDISANLYASQHTGPGSPSEGDLDLIGRLIDALASVDEPLAARFDGPTVQLVGAAAQPTDDHRPQRTWKPERAVWTAPMVGASSAWARWAGRTGNARPWVEQIRYESPPPSERLILSSLAVADEVRADRSIDDLLAEVRRSGRTRIDFSWRCVLEAESSVLLGDRPSGAFPTDLGTESSLWLEPPAGGEVVASPSGVDRPREGPPSGWFVGG